MLQRETIASALQTHAQKAVRWRSAFPLRCHAIAMAALFMFSSNSTIKAQGDWDVGLSAGMSNYIGDIGDGTGPGRAFIWDLQELKSRPAFGVFVRRKLDPSGLWHIRSDFSKIHIAGSDKNTQYAPRRGRNLHFRNRMVELSLRLERDLFQAPLTLARQRRAMITIRGFVGVARLYHNPQAQLDTGNVMYAEFSNQFRFDPNRWYDLAPLQTEGVAYETSITTIPFGFMAVIAGQRRGGIHDFYLSLELGVRWTNSDYLDDISSFYADPAQMVGIGAALSSQANQAVLDEAGASAGSLSAHSFIEDAPVIRGNPTNDDWYGTFMVSFGKVIQPRGNTFRRSRSQYRNIRKVRRSPNRRRTRY
ncbi:MAG: hypothetical protein CBC74_005970 [Crocinitomicaceae bacterium TMED114]|nr:MAG: hypothetical protein CBC74_005970 [Crocinitomicaceae bacterium TMED114]